MLFLGSTVFKMLCTTVFYFTPLTFNNACIFRYTAKSSEEKTKLSQELLQRENELKTCQDQLIQYHKKYVSCVLQCHSASLNFYI